MRVLLATFFFICTLSLFSQPLNCNDLPDFPIQASQDSVCAGTNVQLSVIDSAVTAVFQWSMGATGNTVNVIPSQTTTYSVTATIYGDFEVFRPPNRPDWITAQKL